jgi:D-alanyl-D-alanine carboxypeptidase
MPKSSQNDDEEVSYGQNEAPIHASDWHAARETRRLRRQTQIDDHPEIPKIRRASLYSNSSRATHSSYAGTDRQRERVEEIEDYADLPTRSRSTGRISHAGPTSYTSNEPVYPAEQPRSASTRRLSNPSPVFEEAVEEYEDDFDEELDELDDVDTDIIDTREHESRGQVRKASTKPLYRQRPDREETAYRDYPDTDKRVAPISPVLHEPRLYQRRKLSYPQRSLQDQVQRLLHNRTVVVGVVVVLMVVIFLPLFNSLHNNGQSILTLPNSNDATAVVKSGNQHSITITPPNTNRPAPPVYATAAYLMDASTGKVLYAKNPFEHLPIMSTTKLMTVALAVQYGNLNQSVTINDKIANDLKQQLSPDSSVMGIKKGETYTLRDLLYGMLLVSGNDAAIVVADTVSGSVPAFVVQMNKEAVALGMNDTHYVNPDGLLADGQYSSAHDLAIIARYSLDNAQVHQISNTIEYKIVANKSHAAHDMLNGNQFLWWYPGTDAGKTGWDAGANFVQAISCVRNGKHLIGVVIHTVNWWTDMRDLMNWGFNDFVWVSPRDIETKKSIIYADEWSFFADDTKTVTIVEPNGGRYYIYSGYSMVAGPIMKYFDKNKGVQKFGYPISQASTANGTTQIQKFERGTMQCNLKTTQCTFKA